MLLPIVLSLRVLYDTVYVLIYYRNRKYNGAMFLYCKIDLGTERTVINSAAREFSKDSTIKSPQNGYIHKSTGERYSNNYSIYH